MEENELKQNLILLDNYRKNLEAIKQHKKELLDELEGNPEYQECRRVIDSLNETVETLEKEIKSNAVVLYSQSLSIDPETSKSLFDGNVKIQNKTIAEILDETIAFEWAKINAPQMLILDKNTLLKHAIAVKKTLPLIFVKITEKPVATIASEIKFEE